MATRVKNGLDGISSNSERRWKESRASDGRAPESVDTMHFRSGQQFLLQGAFCAARNDRRGRRLQQTDDTQDVARAMADPDISSDGRDELNGKFRRAKCEGEREGIVHAAIGIDEKREGMRHFNSGWIARFLLGENPALRSPEHG